MFHVKHTPLDKLERYKLLLRTYHRTLDLMSARAVIDLDTKVAEAEVYPALIAPRLSPTDRILDVGSGAGLPGVPLALAFPDHPVTWVERRERRANFLRIVAGQLGLANVTVVGDDIRHWQAPPHRWVCAQAVGRYTLLYCLTRHLHAHTVTLITRRSDLSPSEQADLERVTGPVLAAESVPLPTHGKLIALRLQGGRVCPSSV